MKPAQCGNEDCRNGWLPLDDAYCVEMAEGDPLRFAVLRNSVVPCPVDLPGAYERWLRGEYEPSSAIRNPPRRKKDEPAPPARKQEAPF